MRFSGTGFFFLSIFISCSYGWENFEGSLEDDTVQRSPRLLLNPFSILGNPSCMLNQDEGRCYGEVECLALAGNYGPFCDGFRGLCCLFYRTCDQRTSREVSYFQNTQWPLEHQSPNTCTFKVVRRGNDYCGLSVRAQIPQSSTVSQHCHHTNLYIDGAGTNHKPFPLCKNGRNSAIDYTIDISNLKEVRLHVNSSTRTSAAWKIKVNQIKCANFDGPSDNTDGPGSGSISTGSDSNLGVTPPTTTSTTRRSFTQPAPPAPPPKTTTTTRRPPPITNYAKCGKKRNGRGGKDLISDYFGVNRKKVPSRGSSSNRPSSSASSPETPRNADGIDYDNPFIKDLEYDGPDVTDSLFHYWKGPDSLLTSRVTYGENADQNEYPWQIAMFVGSRYHCGGSIIGDRFILTAAHCVVSYQVKPSVLTLSLGDYDVSTKSDGPYIAAKIETVRIHPSYSRSTLQNDVAVLKLTKRIEYSQRVAPVCLPTSDIPTDGKRATITGWGRDQNKRLKKILQELTSTIVTNDHCSRQWQNQKAPSGFIVGTMMCMDSTHGDSCNGDSGGPSVIEYPAGSGTYVQIGIVSFGSGSCTDKTLPGVYTRVSKYRDWIRQQMY